MVSSPGVKDPVVLKGYRFSTVEEEGVTTHVAGFNPTNCALRGLIVVVLTPLFVTPVVFTRLQASMRLLPAPVETLAGTPLTYGKPGFKNDGFLAWGRRS